MRGMISTQPTTLWIDSEAAIIYRKNPGASTKQKHIDLRQSWLRENSAEVDSTHIDTKKNGADIFTKLPTPAMYLYWHNKFMCKASASLFKVQQQQSY